MINFINYRRVDVISATRPIQEFQLTSNSVFRDLMPVGDWVFSHETDSGAYFEINRRRAMMMWRARGTIITL